MKTACCQVKPASSGQTAQPPCFDLLISGGQVFDAAQSLYGQIADVAVTEGRIAAVGRNITGQASQIIDAAGCLVMPGLIDIHTHVYEAVTSLSIAADPVALATGVTTVVDCGSAGAATFAGFKQHIAAKARCRVLAAVNISTIGLADMPECGYAAYVDSNRAYQCIADNRELAVAVKIRASRNALGDQGTIQTLWMAREAAEMAGVPLIAHLGEPPPAYEEILAALRPGDILTHCFRKGPMHCPVAPDGRIKSIVQETRQRGVLFDVGHGRGSFSWQTARQMMAQGFFPDIISTDMHIESVRPPVSISMPDVMSKMLHLGMPMPDVVAAATLHPARGIGFADRIGSLLPGQTADIAVLQLQQGCFTLSDSHHVLETVKQKLAAVWTITGGVPIRCRG